MQWTSFQRARRFGERGAAIWVLYLIAVVSALLVPLLVLLFGLVVHMLLLRAGVDEVPSDTVLGPWVSRVTQVPPSQHYNQYLLLLIGSGLTLALLESFSLILLARQAQRAATRQVAQLQAAIHAQAFRHGASGLLGARRSRPEELFTEKAASLREGLAAWWQTIPRSILAAGLLLLMAVLVNLWLTVLALVLAGLVSRVAIRLRERAEQQARVHYDRARHCQAVLLEALSLAPLTAGYLLQEAPGEPIEENLRKYEQASFKGNASEAMVTPLLLMLVLLCVAFVLLIVGLSPTVTVAGTVVLATALICAYFPARQLYRLFQALREPNEAAEQIMAYLDREPGVRAAADAKPMERLRHDIRLQHVTLADRHGRKLLDDVSLAIPAGKRVAIVASDGQTPMALAGLFVRYYDPAAGQILYDGRDIREATLDTVRGQAVLVSPEALLFTGSVSDNIGCGDSGFTKLQITDAAREVRALELIQQLPQGFDTVVGRHGMNLEQGRAFLIALARALVREPSLLIIAEPNSALDDAVAARIDEALVAVSRNRTTLVLPSRLPTLRNAESVILFHQGRLHAYGTHAELLQSSDLYRHLNYVRFNPFRDQVK